MNVAETVVKTIVIYDKITRLQYSMNYVNINLLKITNSVVEIHISKKGVELIK